MLGRGSHRARTELWSYQHLVRGVKLAAVCKSNVPLYWGALAVIVHPDTSGQAQTQGEPQVEGAL